jgi:hypothetical protein
LEPGGLKSGTGALQDQLALHSGKARHDMKEEAPCGRLRVDTVGYALEMHLLGFQFVNQIHQSFHAAPEPVQFPDHEGIGFAQVGQRALLGPDGRPARR